jgi:hypothetical protein
METIAWEGKDDPSAKKWAVALPFLPVARAAYEVYGRVVVRPTGELLPDGREVVEVHPSDQGKA